MTTTQWLSACDVEFLHHYDLIQEEAGDQHRIVLPVLSSFMLKTLCIKIELNHNLGSGLDHFDNFPAC